MEVSKEMALFIADQFGGQYDGHMAAIPHNPTLLGIAKAHGLPHMNKTNHAISQYSDFFISVGEALKEIKA